jgi:predicted HicB family RNase H-like nuclease
MTKINLHGSISVGPYKGYLGQAQYEDDDRAFHGAVVGTRAVIHFTGTTPEEVSQAFADSVDEYLRFCAADGDSPEKPFSGKFLVRIKSETHRELVKLADQAGQSLNQFVSDALDSIAQSRGASDGLTSSRTTENPRKRRAIVASKSGKLTGLKRSAKRAPAKAVRRRG